MSEAAFKYVYASVYLFQGGGIAGVSVWRTRVSEYGSAESPRACGGDAEAVREVLAVLAECGWERVT